MRQTASLQVLPDGPAGTRATLKVMAGFVRDSRKLLPIRNLALAIVRGVPGQKNFPGMAAALTNWVKGNIQYVRDINEVETVQTPAVTLKNGQGDCDDQSTLLATLLEAVGFETRFRAIKTDAGGPFVHVVAEANINGQWVPLETTEPWQPGEFPVNVAGEMVQNVNGNTGFLSGFLGLLGLGAVTAASLFTPAEISFLTAVWPSVRVAKNWTDPNWAAMGYPSGPPLSANSNAIISATWGSVRRAARFSDINWAAENIPANLIPVAPAPAPAPAPVVATPNYNGSPVNSVAYQVIAGAWPQIRGAANWTDINWQAIGLSAPVLDSTERAAMVKYWSQIRVARWFSDINWKAIGYGSSAAAQPVPEVTASGAGTKNIQPVATTAESPPTATTSPAAQPVPEVTPTTTGSPSAPVTPFTPYDWSWLFGTPQPSVTPEITPQLAPGDTGDNVPTITPTVAPVQAGMFGNAKTMLIMAALGIGVALYYGRKDKRRGKRARR